MSQAAETLLRPSGSSPRRHVREAHPQRVELRGVQQRVGEEGAGAAGVRVGRVEHHPLAPAQREHRLAHVAQRGALALLDAERAGQLGVPDRLGQLRQPQREAHGEHDPAAGRGLQDAVPVGEAEVGQLDDLAGGAVAAPARRRRSARRPGRTRRCSARGCRRPGRGCRTAPRRRPARRRRRARRRTPTPRRRRRSAARGRRPARRPGRAPRRAAPCPATPSSGSTTLLPPPRTSSGSPAASHAADDVDDGRPRRTR